MTQYHRIRPVTAKYLRITHHLTRHSHQFLKEKPMLCPT